MNRSLDLFAPPPRPSPPPESSPIVTPDVVVTVPKGIWFEWIAEGDAAGEPEMGEEWGFYLGGPEPKTQPGARVYVVAHGRLRGYSLLTRIGRTGKHWALCRGGGAVAVTIPQPIQGFRGWRYRWWPVEDELPFPAWKTEGVR